MPTVRKISGGRVVIRSAGKRITLGDEIEVSEEKAAHLCDGRGDFERVDGSTTDDQESDPFHYDDFGDAVDVVRDAVSVDPSEHTNDEIAELVEDVDDVDELTAIRELEEHDQNRTGATDAIDARIEALED